MIITSCCSVNSRYTRNKIKGMISLDKRKAVNAIHFINILNIATNSPSRIWKIFLNAPIMVRNVCLTVNRLSVCQFDESIKQHHPISIKFNVDISKPAFTSQLVELFLLY